METRVVEITLPNGATALVRATQVDGGGATKTGFGDRFDFSEVTKTLEGVSEAIKDALVKATPDKTTVQLGIEIALKAGKLTGLIVEGEGKGSLTVTLEWNHGGTPR